MKCQLPTNLIHFYLLIFFFVLTLLTFSFWAEIYPLQFESWLTGPVGRVFANGLKDLGSIPDRITPKTLKMVLDIFCLTLRNIRYVLRVKWSNPGKRVVPFLTPLCSSYWKGSLLVALDYGCQLYLLYFHLSKPVLWLIKSTTRVPAWRGQRVDIKLVKNGDILKNCFIIWYWE